MPPRKGSRSGRKRRISGRGKSKITTSPSSRKSKSRRGLRRTSPKPPRKLYAAGEVVRESGISRQQLHNYTVLGLLVVAERTPTNRRYYDESVFERIRLIRRMLDSGYTLQSLREIFPWE